MNEDNEPVDNNHWFNVRKSFPPAYYILAGISQKSDLFMSLVSYVM